MPAIGKTLDGGGPECTIVRIGDQFRNEVDETGHLARIEDLDAIAEVGIRTLRYPYSGRPLLLTTLTNATGAGPTSGSLA